MKYAFIFCFVLFSLTSFSQSTDQKQILKVLADQVEAWNKGDIDLFMKLGYWQHDSLAMIGRSGVTYGYDNVLNNYKKNYSNAATIGKLKFDILQVKELSAGYHFVIGKWFLTRTAGDVGGHYTLVFRKINGQWLIVADHSS